MGIRVGIDLGTTFSSIAKIDKASGNPMVIKNTFNSSITPSVLYFEENGNILFGLEAKNMQALGDMNSVAFFKRNMGKNDFSINIHGKSYNATDLSAIFLEKIKEEAETQTGEKIDSAVITVPAYFTHKEREATIEAGKRAKLEVISIINEPTAAAFAYGLNNSGSEQTVLIYDLGGGTFDVTVAKIKNDEINILGSDGNHELGGKDWDDCIARYIASEFNEKYGEDISSDEEMSMSLLVTAENVKKQLTSKDFVSIPLKFRNISGSIDITKELFESISQFLLGITKELTEKLINSINLSWRDIDGVILVGGSTRMRMIHGYVRDMSGKEPLSGVNVDEAVALGAAIRANINEKGEPALLPGAVFNKNKENITLIKGAKAVTDVTAHALGMIAVSEDGNEYINSVIISKNSIIPSEKTKPYNFRTRAKDNELEVYVLQGEYKRPLDNIVINKYVIKEIEDTNSKQTIINVTYRYTPNGIIEVGAIQTENKKKLPVKIEPVPEDLSWTDGSPRDNLTKTEAQNTEIILIVDLSGSMKGSPLDSAKKAMIGFVNKMDMKNTSFGIISFADDLKNEISVTNDEQALQKAISKLHVRGGTTAEPFTITHTMFVSKKAVKYIVVLTDGQWTHPEPAIKAAKKCHEKNIQVIALGFGEADYKFLKKIASTDEFASVTDIAELGNSFSKIAQAIGELKN